MEQITFLRVVEIVMGPGLGYIRGDGTSRRDVFIDMKVLISVEFVISARCGEVF